jgi:MSHA pilin protein MshC
MNRVKDIKGFTLIEIVAVFVIIGVLGAIAAVRFTSTSTISVRAAAEMIQADIRYVQEASMAEYAAKSVIFVSGSTSYTVDSEIQELPSGITITSNFTVTFNSLGEPTTGGGGSVTISGDSEVEITVADITGKVEIN